MHYFVCNSGFIFYLLRAQKRPRRSQAAVCWNTKRPVVGDRFLEVPRKNRARSNKPSIAFEAGFFLLLSFNNERVYDFFFRKLFLTWRDDFARKELVCKAFLLFVVHLHLLRWPHKPVMWCEMERRRSMVCDDEGRRCWWGTVRGGVGYDWEVRGFFFLIWKGWSHHGLSLCSEVGYSGSDGQQSRNI